MSQLSVATDLEHINEFRRLHRPPLTLAAMHPPVGNPNGDHLDALLETEDHSARIAVEVTRVYRGDRASGEAKIEEQLLGRWYTWLRDVAVTCLGARGYRVTFTIYQTVGLIDSVPLIKEFLRSSGDQTAVRTAIERALRTAERDRRAAMIGVREQDPTPLFRWASHVYVELITPAASTEVEYKFKEPVPGGDAYEWRTPIPRVFWTDTRSLIDAIADKQAKLDRYRKLAEASGAGALSLLLVVEESCAWDLIGALRGDRSEEFRAALAAHPQFDEVYVLTKGPWLPEGWDFKRDGLHNASGPIWKLERLWPLPQQGPAGARQNQAQS
ncbi:MAG TPA: hypothetical protein VKT83_06110 [bacterium]|nr:hypothetical protein [bacterium]